MNLLLCLMKHLQTRIACYIKCKRQINKQKTISLLLRTVQGSKRSKTLYNERLKLSDQVNGSISKDTYARAEEGCLELDYLSQCKIQTI